MRIQDQTDFDRRHWVAKTRYCKHIFSPLTGNCNSCGVEKVYVASGLLASDAKRVLEEERATAQLMQRPTQRQLRR